MLLVLNHAVYEMTGTMTFIYEPLEMTMSNPLWAIFIQSISARDTSAQSLLLKGLKVKKRGIYCLKCVTQILEWKYQNILWCFVNCQNQRAQENKFIRIETRHTRTYLDRKQKTSWNRCDLKMKCDYHRFSTDHIVVICDFSFVYTIIQTF